MANIKLTNDNWETSGIYDITQGKTQRQINSDLNGAVNTITPLDSTPTANSTKGVTSGGVKTALTSARSEIEQSLQSDLSSFVTTWLQNNFDPTTELPLDESLSIHGSAADAMATGDADAGINNVLKFVTEQQANLVDPRNIIWGWFTNANIINTENLRKDAIVYIKCKPSASYYVKKGYADRFQIATTTSKPYVGITVENKWSGNASTEQVYTTNANAVYLCVWFWDDYQNKSTFEEALNNLLIVESSTAKSYSEPYSAIDRTARTSLVNTLKRMPDLVNGQDLNDCAEAGWYFGTSTHVYRNQPPTMVAKYNVKFLVVFPETYVGSTTYRNQMMYGIQDGVIAFRTYASSTGWQNWRTFTNSVTGKLFTEDLNTNPNYWGSPSTSTKTNKGEKLKVASWNVCHFDYDTSTLIGNSDVKKLTTQKKILMDMDADILFVQEDAEQLNSAGTAPSVQYFYKPIYPYKYGTSIKNPIYSKFPLTFLEEYAFNDGSGRTATFCNTTIDNKTVLLVNYHAVVDSTQQATQWTAFVNHVKSYTYDYLVMGGDWNTETQAQLDRVASTCSTEGWTMCNGGYLGYICTWFENKPDRSGGALQPEAIDHIVVSNNIIPNKIKVYQEYAYYIYTDHVPITSELTFTT